MATASSRDDFWVVLCYSACVFHIHAVYVLGLRVMDVHVSIYMYVHVQYMYLDLPTRSTRVTWSISRPYLVYTHLT